MTRLQIRMLTALLNLSEQGSCVTDISALFGLAKSTVSRAAQELAGEGLVSKGERSLRLTAIGRRKAGEYQAQFQRLFLHLRGGGVPPEQAVQDSYTMLTELSAETCDAIVRALRPVNDFETEGSALGRPDGIYDLSFAIYSLQSKGVRSLSMANNAFAHPAQLAISGGRGVVRLEAVSVRHTSAFHDQLMSGSLNGMSYQKSGRYFACLIEGNTVSIPLESLRLMPVPEHGLLLGEVVIKIFPNVDEKHMPERTALFTAYF